MDRSVGIEKAKYMTNNNMPAGPLKVCSDNPRYLATPGGNAVYLTGSHTWACLHERLLPETQIFDYSVWLDMMEGVVTIS
jgi:hypothetical protein